MLHLTFPHHVLDRIDAARQQLGGDSRLMERLGQVLTDLVKGSLRTRSKGSEAAGILWEPLSSSRVQEKLREGEPASIGIATGELFASGAIELAGDHLTFAFAASHAQAFNRLRRLLPETLPEDWQERLEEVAQEWADEILTEQFDTL